MLEVMSIIMMVSVRSLMPPRQFQGTSRVQSSEVKEVSKHRICEQIPQGPVLGARQGGGEAGHTA